MSTRPGAPPSARRRPRRERRRWLPLRGGALALLVALVVCTLAPPLLGLDPLGTDLDAVLQPPSWQHPCGTDGLGRDLLARVVVGGRTSLLATTAAVAVAFVLGTAFGALSGLGPRLADRVVGRGVDLLNAFPALVGAIAILGAPTLPEAAAARAVLLGAVVGLFGFPAVYRLVRGELLRLRDGDLALAARAIGAHPARIALRHLLPLALRPALAPLAFVGGGAVVAEAGLGFLGLGVPPPTPSWGSLLLEASQQAGRGWWLAAVPGACIFAVALACQSLARGPERGLGTGGRRAGD